MAAQAGEAEKTSEKKKKPLKNVDIGFLVDDTPSWELQGKFFPSKLGGQPAWLALGKPPTLDQLSCQVCKKPATFLLQIYAPIEEKDGEDDNDAFHRSLFVFLCRTPACSKDNWQCTNFAVFRSQLPRKNPYYSYEPADEEDQSVVVGTRLRDHVTTCWVCGLPTDGKKCGACKVASYCSQEHQKLDWKAGHKKGCGTEQEPSNSLAFFPFILLLFNFRCEFVFSTKSDLT